MIRSAMVRGFVSSCFLWITVMAWGQAPKWEYAGYLYCSWATHNSMGLGKGYMYRFDLTEAQWRSTPEDWLHWYNRILLKKTADRTLVHTFNDLTPYDSLEAAKAASPASFSMVAKENTGVRLWLHDTIYQDHLFGDSECEVWRYPPAEVSVSHSYALTTAYASPTRIIADGNSESEIWVWLSRDGSLYDGEDGSEHTEYVKVTTDKGSFRSYEDLKEAWIFYSDFGDWIPLYADTTPGTAHVTVEWDARNDGGTYVRHINVAMGEYSMVVSADPEAINADGESTATITAQVTPYTGAGGEFVILKTGKGSFSNGSDTVDAVLNASGTATATFVAPQEKGYCFITGDYNYASDTASILALGKTLIVTIKPDSLLANSDLHASVEVQLFDGYNGSMDGEIVTLTTDLGLFENGSRTIEFVIGNQRTVLLHPDDGQAGTATVSGVWVGAEETLSNSDTIDFFTTALSIQSDKSVLWANGEESAQVMVSLFKDGQVASGGSVVVETNLGSLSNGNTTGSALTLPLSAGGSVTCSLIASDEEGTATLIATYPAEGLSDSCTVEMKDYQLSITAQTAEYHSITDTSTDEFTTRQFPEGEPPQATTHGLTAIPVTLILEGPVVNGQQVNLTSSAQNAVSGAAKSSITLPDSVWIYGGTAEFTVQVANLHQYNNEQGAWGLNSIDLQATLAIDPDAADSVSFPLVDNMEMLLNLYRTSLPKGPVLEQIDKVQWFTPGGVIQYYAGAMNNAASDDNPLLYNPFTCGGYQVQTLHFFDDLRLNHPEMNWLLNGLDYGPVKQLGGAHLAACIWPSDVDNWADPEFGHILDPWITQNPESGVYTWEGWLLSIGISMPFVGVALEIYTDAGSSEEYVAQHYPNTGNDYPDKPYWEFPQFPGPSIGVIVDCPVHVMITDGLGNRTGIDPTVPDNQNPLVSQIPGLNQYPMILPNGERGWYFEIPDAAVTMELSGYDDGNFTMYLMYPSGEVVPYSRAGIAEGQKALIGLDPSAATVPVVLYANGDIILPDKTLTIEAWTYNPITRQSEAFLILSNTYDQPLYGPFRLTIEQINPVGIALIDPDGNSDGKDYIDFSDQIPGGVLNPGQSIQRTIVFTNPNRQPFNPIAVLTAYVFPSQTRTARVRWIEEGLGLPLCGDVNHPYLTGDFNQDCYLDIADFVLLSQCWQQPASGPCAKADLEVNGAIDLADLAAFCGEWMTCTDPESPCSFLP